MLAFAMMVSIVSAQNSQITKERSWKSGGCSLDIRITFESLGERADGDSTVTGKVRNDCPEPLTIDEKHQHSGFRLYPSDGLFRDQSRDRDVWVGFFSLFRALGATDRLGRFSIAANESAVFSVKFSDVHWHLGRSSMIDFSENGGAVYKVPPGDWLLELYFWPYLQTSDILLDNKKPEKAEPVFPFESNSVRVKL